MPARQQIDDPSLSAKALGLPIFVTSEWISPVAGPFAFANLALSLSRKRLRRVATEVKEVDEGVATSGGLGVRASSPGKYQRQRSSPR